jgi:uncharacterized protein (TIGR02118 family)
MAGMRVIVLYPRPTDSAEFERKYEEHLSWVSKRIPGLSRFMVGKILSTPSGETPPFYRIAQLSFPSMDALQAALQSPGTQEAVADAVALSSGGAPVFLIAEEEQPVPV